MIKISEYIQLNIFKQKCLYSKATNYKLISQTIANKSDPDGFLTFVE